MFQNLNCYNCTKFKSGFTLIEVLVVIFILATLLTIVLTNFPLIKNKTELENGVSEFVATLRLAQSKSISSESLSQYGVYIDTSVSPHKYTLFKGASFASRESAFDQFYWIPKDVEFYNINFSNGSEVVFDRLTGFTNQSGSAGLRVKNNNAQNKIIYLANSGVVSFNASVVGSDDDRIKDSRHIHFDYARSIDTATETITLNFDNGSLIHTFPISSYVVSSQIELTDTANVGGVNQVVRIHTHNLNDPVLATQFSIYRDRRLNTKSLVITIPGDSSGNLVNYSADGLTTSSSSIYINPTVSSSNWQ